MNQNRKIINAISSKSVPAWGNKKKYIAIHYLGVVGQNHDLAADGCGAHFYIYWDGTIYQRCSLDAVPWAVGTAGVYTQKHPEANNYNTISIEMCCKCDGNSSSAEDKKWYFTEETQEACVWLVQKLMEEENIPADHVLRHYDIVNKTCPAPYVHNNKYKTSWTWSEFKARLGSSSTPSTGFNIKGIAIGDSNVEAISKVVYGEAGVIQSYDALIAVAQCIHDMLQSGQFGKTITEVMQRNFSAYGSKETTDDARQAVYDVFCHGKRRFSGAQILQFRSFTKYSDGCGHMDKNKCASLLAKYEYLGKDARNNQWGHLYFGCKNTAATPTPETKYFVRKSWADKASQLDAYENMDNAKKRVDGAWQYNVYDEAGNCVYNGAQALVDRAVDWMIGISNDDTHGYTNGKWGPEYSCLSLVEMGYITAGLPITRSNIDKMPANLIKAGFEDCTAEGNLKTGGGLAKGDILWMLDSTGKHGHVECYIGDGKLVGARGDTDGKPGDSKGDEISVISYRDMGWQRAFRLPGVPSGEKTGASEGTGNTSNAIYRVQVGAYNSQANAKNALKKVRAAGYPDAFLRHEDGMYKIQAWAGSRSGAEKVAADLKKKGISAIIK